jgi:hypothetical protein
MSTTTLVLGTLDVGAMVYAVLLLSLPAVYRGPLERGFVTAQDAEANVRRLALGIMLYGIALLLGSLPHLTASGAKGIVAWCGIVFAAIGIVVGLTVRRTAHTRIGCVAPKTR